MGAREIWGVELEIKPSWGAMRACGVSPTLEVPAQPWHLQCRSRLLCLLPSLPEREGCFHPSPSRKKSLIQAFENICKSNYLPRALPGALPACPPPSAPGSPGFLLPGCFSGHTKGWHGRMQAPLCSSFVRSCSAHRCHDSSSLSSRHRCHGRLPISGLGMGGGSHVPWPGAGGGHIQAPQPTSQPTSSRDVPWWAQGTPSPAPPRFGAWAPCPVSRFCCFLRGAGQSSRGHSVPAAFPLIVIF